MIDIQDKIIKIPRRILDARRDWSSPMNEDLFVRILADQSEATPLSLIKQCGYADSGRNYELLSSTLHTFTTPCLTRTGCKPIPVLQSADPQALELSPEMCSALSETKDGYNIINLRQLQHLKSYHSKRLYEIGAAWSFYTETNDKPVVFSIEQLRKMLSIPDTMRDRDFIRRVLTPTAWDLRTLHKPLWYHISIEIINDTVLLDATDNTPALARPPGKGAGGPGADRTGRLILTSAIAPPPAYISVYICILEIT